MSLVYLCNDVAGEQMGFSFRNTKSDKLLVMKKSLSQFTQALFFLSLIFGIAQAQTNDEAKNLHIYPYLQWSTPTSIIIKWETIKKTTGTVIYGEKENFGNQQAEKQPVKLHEVKLTNLKPATTYYYQVKYDEISLAPATFTTAPEPGTKHWRMVAYGDNRTYPQVHKKIVDQVLKLKPSMIIHSGDLVSRGDEYEQWKEQYFDPMRGLAENITVFPSLGNHERNHQHYYDYMSLPDENGESFYSFDYGNAHFIALNSNSDEAPYSLDSDQTKWLIEDLKANKDAQWKIVFFHHPLFRCHPTRGIEEQRWVWQEVFEEYGIDLVVNGHDHYYQRTYAIGNYQGEPSRGVYHLISGGGGAPNYPIVPKLHAANRRSVHHFTVMDFMDDRIVGRAIDAEGNIFDAFVYDKEAENSPEEFLAYEIFEIERNLAESIYQLPVVKPNREGIFMDQEITIENPFKHPLKMTFNWESSSAWQTNETREEILEPGKPIKLSLKASINKAGKSPSFIPSASLNFQSPDGKIVFKNHTIVFHPIKIWNQKSLTASKLKKTPTIDGDFSEFKFGDQLISDFYDAQNGQSPKQEVHFKIAHKNEKLYIIGQVEAGKSISKSGQKQRDHRDVYRSENIQVYIGVGENVYSFAVNPLGTIHDTKNGDIKWNSNAVAASIPSSNGWQFELEIPLDDLEFQGSELKINLARNDRENRVVSEYSLTYGKSDLDHRIPMYEPDFRAVERFSTLELGK